MLIKCEDCGHDVSDKAFACPYCACPINPNNSPPIIQQAVNEPKKSIKRANKRPMKRANRTGSIRHLNGNRRNPYAAYPSVTDYYNNGTAKLPKAIGYYRTYSEALEALILYNRNPYDLDAKDMSFSDVYQLYFKDKYEDAKKTFSEASRKSTASAYRNCSELHELPFCKLRTEDFQRILDNCPLKHSSLELIKNLFTQMSQFAMQRDIIEKNYAQFAKIPIADDDETGEPFFEDELEILWKNSSDQVIQKLLIMIYSGFRISAFKTIEINFAEGYFKGGVKTKAGKGRIVPIHPAIRPFLTETTFYKFNPDSYREAMHKALDELGINISKSGKVHTPHDARHTFSWLCDKYGVNELSKHLLMGHSLGSDIEQKVYGHRTIEELRTEIEKICV